MVHINFTIFTIQSTQCGFYVFRVATAAKFYLERTIAGVSKQTVTMIVR